MTTSTLTKTDYCENLIPSLKESIENHPDYCPESTIQLVIWNHSSDSLVQIDSEICPCCKENPLWNDQTSVNGNGDEANTYDLINEIVCENIRLAEKTQFRAFFDIHVRKGFGKKAKFFLKRFYKSYVYDGTDLIEYADESQ